MTALPWGSPLDYDDLRRMPDDGHRYELVDGSLLGTPSPVPAHQLVVTRLVVLLEAACPRELVVLPGPCDYVISKTTILVPDLLVARWEDVGEANVLRAPQLVVEVRSPSTWKHDLGTKRLAYEGAGVSHYWVVDPDEPGIVVFELGDGGYHEVARATGNEPVSLDAPFPVTIVPARLVDRLRP